MSTSQPSVVGCPEPAEPARRPGGRSERVRAATLAAALEQLLAGGYDALSVHEVAKAAGVAVTTVYRRWPTKADLAVAALGAFAVAENPMPDTGTLAGDLRALLAQIVALLRRPEVERLLRAAAALDASTAGAEDARATFWRARFAGSADLVARAISRGELAPGTDPEALVEMLVSRAYLRLLVTGRPLDDDFQQTCLAQTLAACDAGAPR